MRIFTFPLCPNEPSMSPCSPVDRATFKFKKGAMFVSFFQRFFPMTSYAFTMRSTTPSWWKDKLNNLLWFVGCCKITYPLLWLVNFQPSYFSSEVVFCQKRMEDSSFKCYPTGVAVDVGIEFWSDEKSIRHCGDGMVEFEEAEISYVPTKHSNNITIYKATNHITSRHPIRRTDCSSSPC